MCLLQGVLRELEQKKPQLDELLHTAESLKGTENRQQLHGKGRMHALLNSLVYSRAYLTHLNCLFYSIAYSYITRLNSLLYSRAYFTLLNSVFYSKAYILLLKSLFYSMAYIYSLQYSVGSSFFYGARYKLQACRINKS